MFDTVTTTQNANDCSPVRALASSGLAVNGALRIEVSAETDADPDSFAIAEVQIFDTYEVTAPSSVPGPNVEIKLRVALHGCVTNATGEYDMFARLHDVVGDPGQVGFPIGPPVGLSRRTEGADQRVFDRTFTVKIGDRVVLAPVFDFALAFAELGAPRAAAVAEVSVCPVTPGVVITANSGATGNCVPNEEANVFTNRCIGDINLVRLETVQSVPGVTLVENKPTVFKLTIDNTFRDPVPAEVTFEIERLGLPKATLTDNVLLAPECKMNYYFPDPIPIFGSVCDPTRSSPSDNTLQFLGIEIPEGAFRAKATIKPLDGGSDADPSNDMKTTPTFAVRPTSLNLVYTDISCELPFCPPDPDGYGSVTQQQFAETVEWSNRHLLAMYPLAPDGLNASICDLCSVHGSTGPPCPSPECIVFETDAKLAVQALTDFGISKVDRVVGLVPPDYFQFHGTPPTVAGVSVPTLEGIEVILVNVDYPTGKKTGQHDPTVPHELGHTYGVDHVETPTPDGYWVGCQEELGIPFAQCESERDADRLMSAFTSQKDPPGIWIDSNFYRATLLPSLAAAGPDPPLVAIVGSVRKDGTISVDSVLELPAGATRPLRGGEYFIDMLDASGSTLASTSHSVRFKAFFRVEPGTPGPTEAESDSAMMAVVLEYPIGTAAIQFRKGSTVLRVIDPLSMSLRRVIEAIPESAFEKHRDDDSSSDDDSKSDDDSDSAAQRRKALLKRVTGFEKRLSKGDRKGALKKLANIKKTVERLSAFPAPIDNDKVLQQIGFLEDRLRAQSSSSQ